MTRASGPRRAKQANSKCPQRQQAAPADRGVLPYIAHSSVACGMPVHAAANASGGQQCRHLRGPPAGRPGCALAPSAAHPAAGSNADGSPGVSGRHSGVWPNAGAAWSAKSRPSHVVCWRQAVIPIQRCLHAVSPRGGAGAPSPPSAPRHTRLEVQHGVGAGRRVWRRRAVQAAPHQLLERPHIHLSRQ